MFSSTTVRFGARALLLGCAALTLTACATITRGTSQNFSVQSTPPGAQVSTSNGFQCQSTPCTFRMPRKDAFRVTISMDGYVTQNVDVTTGISGGGGTAMAGNLIFGGIVGGVVDASSGAMNDLKPNPLIVQMMTPEQKAVADAAAAEMARMAPATAAKDQ